MADPRADFGLVLKRDASRGPVEQHLRVGLEPQQQIDVTDVSADQHGLRFDGAERLCWRPGALVLAGSAKALFRRDHAQLSESLLHLIIWVDAFKGSTMDNHRPIDTLRNSGAQLDVGTEDDRSPIKAMCVINNSMHVIKGQGIYRVQLADEIDPERTNSAIPNTSQRVLAYGTDCDFVRQTLMTAKRLFDSKLLGSSFPYERAINLSFEALNDIVATHELRARFAAEVIAAEASLKELKVRSRAYAIPSIEGVRESVETFLQKADHAIADLFEIAKLFYPAGIGNRWFESLLQLVKTSYGPDATFTKFLVEALPLLKLVRNARNCVEHPKPNQRVEVFDITLRPSGELRPPALEVIHPETPQPLMAVTDFMVQMVEQVASIFELMLAFLCGYNVQPFSGVAVQVVRYPPDLEKAFGVKFGYGIDNGDQIIPFG